MPPMPTAIWLRANAPSPSWQPPHICRRSTISGRCRGRNSPTPRNGTSGSNRGRHSAPCSVTRCRASHRRQAMPSSISRTDTKAAIRELALAEGFDVVRFARADAPTQAAERLGAFLADGRQGTMDWMERNADRRADPKVLWPEARSVIVLGMNYGSDHDPLAILGQRDAGAISVYAQGDDYHDVILFCLFCVVCVFVLLFFCVVL